MISEVISRRPVSFSSMLLFSIVLLSSGSINLRTFKGGVDATLYKVLKKMTYFTRLKLSAVVSRSCAKFVIAIVCPSFLTFT